MAADPGTSTRFDLHGFPGRGAAGPQGRAGRTGRSRPPVRRRRGPAARRPGTKVAVENGTIGRRVPRPRR
ncbi:hypothetical protein KCH_00610 [Kitasatospora cheerisanensis KCTC 2395]|uniref:Uncharacterized protein n=1 Tax=Kitasatospora cheerisanensis KCTC 2395 TaxID=1348663 RepID=A0A066ZD26_9ACTN|nr:hypothetical protein KCH_00610 [Kitasatospora cheerisanensis KCTC 2395]